MHLQWLTDQLNFFTHCESVFSLSHTDRREDDIATFRPVVTVVITGATRVPMFKSEKGILF